MFDPVCAPGVLSELLNYLRGSGYEFTTITPSTHARILARSDHGISLRDAFGWTRWCAGSILPDRLFKALCDHDVVELGADRRWRSRIRVSSLADLLLIHSAYPTTAADSVFFGPDTYRFVRAVLGVIANRSPAQHVLDIGCGSGAGGLSVAGLWPQAKIVLSDINRTALAFADCNLQTAGLRNVTLAESDLLTSVPGTFDLIIANPPYMADPLRRNYRDGGGRHGCELSLRIIEEATSRLRPGGALLLYTGAPVSDGVDLFKSAAAARIAAMDVHWSYEEIDPDVFGEELENDSYADVERIAAVLLTIRKDLA